MKLTSAAVLFGVLGLGVLGLRGHKQELAHAIFGEGSEARAYPLIITANRDTADRAVVAIVSDDGTCTGTLIAPRYVLTARHCVEEGETVWVSFHTELEDGGGTRAVAHLPPTWRDMRDDVAILELSRPSSITPIPVNLSAQSLTGLSHIRAVGFGVNETGDSDSAGVRRTGRSRAFVSGNFVQSVPGGEETCYGDSGGPALAMIDGHEQVVGVTSHGTAARCEEGSTRFARTDLHANFLKPYLDGSAPAPTNDVVAEDTAPLADDSPAADDTSAADEDTVATTGEDDCSCADEDEDEVAFAPPHVHHLAKRVAQRSRLK